MDVYTQYIAFIESKQLIISNSNFPSFFHFNPFISHSSTNTEKLFGKRIEEFFYQYLIASSDYQIIEKNIQICYQGVTIGELDFLARNLKTNKIEHIELAYKFYLFNPQNNEIPINCWVGPNNQDYLHLKLKKLIEKQFPLLYHKSTISKLMEVGIEVNKVEQKMLFLGKLYTPFNQFTSIEDINRECLDGFWISHKIFGKEFNHNDYHFFIPIKENWHISIPDELKWMDYTQVAIIINQFILAKKSPMVWVKNRTTTFKLFVTWW